MQETGYRAKNTIKIEKISHAVQGHFQQYISYIVAVSFIGGGNRSKPPT